MGFRSFPFVMQIREMILREKCLILKAGVDFRQTQTNKQPIARHERQMIIALKA